MVCVSQMGCVSQKLSYKVPLLLTVSTCRVTTFPTHIFFHHLADRQGGGVAAYVKDHIQGSEKQCVHNLSDLLFLALKVEAPVSVHSSRPLYEVLSGLSYIMTTSVIMRES